MPRVWLVQSLGVSAIALSPDNHVGPRRRMRLAALTLIMHPSRGLTCLHGLRAQPIRLCESKRYIKGRSRSCPFMYQIRTHEIRTRGALRSHPYRVRDFLVVVPSRLWDGEPIHFTLSVCAWGAAVSRRWVHP